MNKIGGSIRVRNELTAALSEGRGVTAKVRWMFKSEEEGRNRWIHCTPLLGSNGRIGVWMVVLVDEEQEIIRRWRQAPPVNPSFGQPIGAQGNERHHSGSNGEYLSNTFGHQPSFTRRSRSGRGVDGASILGSSIRSSSPYHIS